MKDKASGSSLAVKYRAQLGQAFDIKMSNTKENNPYMATWFTLLLGHVERDQYRGPGKPLMSSALNTTST